MLFGETVSVMTTERRSGMRTSSYAFFGSKPLIATTGPAMADKLGQLRACARILVP